MQDSAASVVWYVSDHVALASELARTQTTVEQLERVFVLLLQRIDRFEYS